MAVDMTFFVKKQKMTHEDCLRIATSLLNQYDEEKCCNECEIIICHWCSAPQRVMIDRHNDLIGQMLYSSGYWCVYNTKKRGDKYQVYFTLKPMTDTEKTRAHNLDVLEDPVAMD